MIEYLADFGGLFALYMLWHFAVDFGAQTHAQGHGKSVRKDVVDMKGAIRKERGYGYLLSHCLVYTVLMAVPLCFLLPPVELAVAAFILWASHMVGDTYLPVYLWFRFVRRPPLPHGTDRWSFAVAGSMVKADPGNGVILMVVDQVYHLLWLLPVIWMVMHHAG